MNDLKYWLLWIGLLLGSVLQAQITIIVPPLQGPYPVVSNAQPIGLDTVQVCMGEEATFQSTALNVPLLNINSFDWDFNGALATNPGNVSTVTTSAWVAPGIYPIVHRVERTIPLIILTPTFSDPDTLWLVVSALPSVSPAPDTAVCRGSGIALQPLLGASTDSIFWFPNPTLSYGREDSVWVMPNTPTTYFYKAYTKATYNGITWGFCKEDWSTTVSVRPPPRVRTLNDTLLCEGDSFTLDVKPPLPPLPVNPVSFEWATDVNFNTIIAVTRRHTLYNITTPSQYYVRITDGNGCTGIDSIQILVRQRPPKPTASVLDNDVCIGEFISLSANDTSVLNIWRGPNGFGAPVGLFDIPAISTAQTGYYTIVSRDGFGCPSFPDSVYVRVNAPPAVPPITGDDAFCAGVPLQLWATPNVGTTLYWRTPIPTRDSLGTNNLLIQADSIHYLSGTWTLVVEDGAGCTNSRDTLITIYPAPVLSTSLRPITICQGQQVTFNAPTLPNVVTYNWLDSVGMWAAQGQSAVLNNITNNSTFFLQVVTAQGCTFILDSVDVFVLPTPSAPSIYVDTLVCIGERNVVFRTDPAQGYFWRRNGRPLSFTDSLVIDTVKLVDSGLYVLSVLDNNGCLSDSVTINFQVNRRPNVPVATINSPVCEGDTVFLDGTVVAGLTAEWRDTFGTRLLGYQVSLPPDSSYYRSGSWRLVVRDSITTCRRRLDVFVQINPAPKIIVSNSGPVCLGQSAVVTAADSLASGATLSFVWYRDAALTDTVSTNATFIVNNIQADSTFYVVATDASGCSSVVKSTTIALGSITPTPVVPATLVACEGDNVQLGTSSTGLIYQWSGPNNYSSVLRSPTIPSIQTNQAGAYNLVITTIGACPSRPATTVVTVQPTPAPPIAIVPFYLCGNDTLYLSTDSSSHCSQLNWIGPNTANFPLSGNNVAIPPGDTNHVGGFWRVECVDSVSGCTSRSTAQFVLIYPAPDTPLVAPVPPVCIGDTATLSLSSLLNSGDVVNWYRDSNLTSFLDNGPSIRVAVNSNQTYYVVVTNFGGCPSVIVPVPVSIIPPSAAPSILGDTAYCVHDSIVLSTSYSSSDYDWSSTTGWSSNSATALVTTQANASHAGTYFLRVKDSNGCWTPTTSWDITINNNPTPPVAYSNSPICEGEPIQLLTNASCGQLQWYGPLGASSATIFLGDASYIPNSQWYVECIDTVTGCSATSNTITIQINEAPLIDSLVVFLPTCEGDSLIALAAASISTNNPLQYAWYDNNTLLGSGDSLVLAAVQQSFILTLVVRDTITGCEQVDTVAIVLDSVPNAPVITGNLNYCEGDVLNLTTPTIASQYYWTGPNGWVDTSNSSIRTLTVLDSGTYYLTVANGSGCLSPISSVVVVVTPLPDSFTSYSGGGVCVGQDGQLFIAGDSTLVYDWYQLPSHTYVGTGTSLVLPNVQASDSAYYYAIARGNVCSLRGDSVLLPVYAPTTVAEAGNDQILCNIDTTTLMALPIPSSVTGVWTSSSAVAILSPTTATTAVGPLPVGIHVFYWTLSNASCSNFARDSVVIEVLPSPSEQANAGADQVYCSNTTINLAAIAPQIGTGCWTQSSLQSSAGVVIVDSLNPASTLTGLQQGQQYSFIWQLKNGSCGIYSTDTVLITIDSLPNTAAFAGLDQTVCLGDSILLQAQAAPAGQTGTWLGLNGGFIVAPNQPNSLVSNLPIGAHQFVWTVSTSNCPNYSRDTITVTVLGAQPVAEPDNFLLSSSNTVIEVINNDLLPNNWIISIQQPMSQGQLTNLNTGEFAVTLSNVTGQQSFVYQICDAICVNSCDTAIVLLSVEQLLECPIPNIFTPNNDGVNDFFEIPCVSDQQTVYLAVYNRWGDEVYRSDSYLNQWDGTHAGAALPDGTYFYLLQWPDGASTQGSVEIRR